MPKEWYIWWTLSLAVWQQAQIGKHLVWRVGMAKDCYEIPPQCPLNIVLVGILVWQ